MMDLSKDLIRSLLDNVDPAQSYLRSFRDFHAKGVNYVNLARGDLTAKLYFFNKFVTHTGPFDTVVNPHTHGYDFQTYVIRGAVTNVVLARGNSDMLGSYGHYEYRYRSPLKGGDRKLELAAHQYLVEASATTYQRGDGYSFDSEGIHSIRVYCADAEAVLFLLQHRDKGKPDTRLFLPTDHPPDTTDLYKPMSVRAIMDYVEYTKLIL